MKNRNLFIILVLFFQLLKVTGFSQTIDWQSADIKTIEDEYRKVTQFYNSLKTVSMRITYTSYQTHTTEVEADKSVGFYKKDGSNYHTYIMGTRTIQNSKYKFTINEDSKIIMVWNADVKVNSVVDFDEKNLDSSIIVSMKIAHLNNESRIRIEYKKELEIQAIEYSISKLGFVKEVVFYYCRNYVNEEGNNEIVYPRLNITFSEVNTRYIPDKNEFNEDKYFSEKEKALKINPSYQSYKIRDYRKSK